MSWWSRKKETETFEERTHLRGEPDDPVRMLIQKPNGQMFDLSAMRATGRNRFTIGRSPFADISLVGDLTVSGNHCILELVGQRVMLKCVGAKNRTLVNGVPLRPRAGAVELVPGAALELGRDTELLVCGGAGEAQIPTKAPPMARLLTRYTRFFGSRRKGAAAMAVASRTFTGWFKKHGVTVDDTEDLRCDGSALEDTGKTGKGTKAKVQSKLEGQSTSPGKDKAASKHKTAGKSKGKAAGNSKSRSDRKRRAG